MRELRRRNTIDGGLCRCGWSGGPSAAQITGLPPLLPFTAIRVAFFCPTIPLDR
jgi:hypothetical protein